MDSLALFFLASVAVGGLAWVFLYPILSGERKAEQRMASVARAEPVARATRGAQKSRRDVVESTLKEIEERHKKSKSPPLTNRIAQAGLSWSKQQFFMISGGVGVAMFMLGIFSNAGLLPAVGMGFAGALGIPRWLLSFLKSRREAKFLNAFPDAVDIIVRGVKAGLPLLDCMKMIATEAPEPLKSEFKTIIETQAIGIPLGEAVGKLYERMPLAEANFFAIVVSIQQKAGGNLSEALGNLSRVLRDRKKMKGKIKAMSQEAKASAGIIGALPIAVMTLVGITSPDYISLLWTEPLGNLMLVASACWMSLGVLVMKKMINFDFERRTIPRGEKRFSDRPRAKEKVRSMIDFLLSYLNTQAMAMLFAAVAAGATVLTLAAPYVFADSLDKRMKSVAIEREKIRQRERERMAQERQKPALRQSPKQYIQTIVERFNLSKWVGQEEARLKLVQAGYRGQAPYVTYLFFRMVTPTAAFIFAAFYIFVVLDFNQPATLKLAMCIAAAYIGMHLPLMLLKSKIQKRQLQIKRAFPDTLDLLLICVESGMSIEAAFKKVAEEIGKQSVALAEELTLTTAELSYLPDRRQAYENLAKRTDLDGVKSVCMALQQAERYGTPLAQMLRVMAQENRDMRMSEAEKKAAGLPPKLTVPMILFFLPVLFVVILGPAAIKVMALH